MKFSKLSKMLKIGRFVFNLLNPYNLIKILRGPMKKFCPQQKTLPIKAIRYNFRYRA